MDEIKELLFVVIVSVAVIVGVVLLLAGLDELIRQIFGYGKV